MRGWLLTIVLMGYLGALARAEGPSLPGYESVPLRFGGANRLALTATIADRPATFLLDTGAALSSIDRSAVRDWKLGPPGRESGIARTKMMNGRKADVVWLPDLKAGGMRFGPLPMTVLPAGVHFGDYGNEPLRGLFGSDLLRRFEAIVNCASGRIYFKTDPHAGVDLARVLEPLGYVAIRLEQRRGVYYAPCKLRKFAFKMLVDTGAFTTIFRQKKIELFGVPSEKTKMRQRGLNGYATTLSRVQPSEHRLSVGGVPIPFAVSATNDPLLERSSEFDELGILGCDLLGRHGAVIDYSTLTLWLRPAGK